MKFDHLVNSLLEGFNVLPQGSTPPNTLDAGTTKIGLEDFTNRMETVPLNLPNKEELKKAKKKKRDQKAREDLKSSQGK